jgi:regulator of sigma E protease
VGGFATFAKLFPEEWNWAMFWERTAFISLILAFMNILPIPALDGGHVMFLLWEMITGRPASQRIMEVAQMIGMVLLLGLMLYGNGMDIFRWFTSH